MNKQNLSIEFLEVSKKYHYSTFSVFEKLSFKLQSKLNTLLVDMQSGKTTICKLILGTEKLDSGEILLNGVDCSAVKPKDKNIAYLADDMLMENKTVFYNIAFPLYARKTDKQTATKKVMEQAKVLGLENLLETKVKFLNQEQKTMVQIARSVVIERDHILIDGLFDTLTPQTLEVALGVVQESTAMVTVLTSEISACFGEVFLIFDSKLLVQGTPEIVAVEQKKLLWLNESNKENL